MRLTEGAKSAAIAIFAVVLVGSFVADRQHANSRIDAQRDASVAGCVLSGTRTALNASFAHDAAVTRTASGDKEVGIRYQADANGQIETIRHPRSYPFGPAVAQVRLVRRHGKLIYVLSPNSARLVLKGCKEAFDN